MGVGPSKIPSDSPLGCVLANLGLLHLMPDLKPQKLIAPSLWAETKPGVYLGMSRATLRDSCLIMASNDCFSSPPCLMLFPKTVTGEWRFHVAESVPVPVNGSALEAQVIANPSGMCHASRLCLPLPYLRGQDTFSASSMVSPHVLSLCLPSPPWAYWDPASHEKLVVWHLMTLIIPTSLPGLSV
jgi:hypothetical protein